MKDLNLALNRYAFHWSYPELVADSEGLFLREGLRPRWSDATPSAVVNKTSMYTDLLSTGATDVYHAGEWACVNRVLRSSGAWIVAKSPPGDGTLNSSFSLYVRGDSDVRTPKDLAGRTVAIEEGTGAQYTALVDLEKHIRRDEIRLVQTGEPHRRLRALVDGAVDSASLVGPWADVGRALGLRLVMRTERTNPTTIVVRKDTEGALLKSFFMAVNGAILMIDREPEKFRDDYLRRVKEILSEGGVEVPEGPLSREVRVSRWEPWTAYTEEDFERTYRWMVSRGLAPEGRSAAGLVGSYPSGTFS